MTFDKPLSPDRISDADLREVNASGEETSDCGTCARCQRSCPEDELIELPRVWIALFGALLGGFGAGREQEARYCESCGKHLKRLMVLVVVIFGGVLLIVGIAELARRLATAID